MTNSWRTALLVFHSFLNHSPSHGTKFAKIPEDTINNSLFKLYKRYEVKNLVIKTTLNIFEHNFIKSEPGPINSSKYLAINLDVCD